MRKMSKNIKMRWLIFWKEFCVRVRDVVTRVILGMKYRDMSTDAFANGGFFLVKL